jgi:hypothetical protein
MSMLYFRHSSTAGVKIINVDTTGAARVLKTLQSSATKAIYYVARNH